MDRRFICYEILLIVCYGNQLEVEQKVAFYSAKIFTLQWFTRVSLLLLSNDVIHPLQLIMSEINFAATVLLQIKLGLTPGLSNVVIVNRSSCRFCLFALLRTPTSVYKVFILSRFWFPCWAWRLCHFLLLTKVRLLDMSGYLVHYSAHIYLSLYLLHFAISSLGL